MGITAEQVYEHISIDHDCWEWHGFHDRDGYAYLSFAQTPVHRVVFEDTFGPMPKGTQIDHLCRNTSCVNPTHLEAVTSAENIRRRVRRLPDACPRGHAYTPENTYVYSVTGHRHCRACRRMACVVADAKRRPPKRKNGRI